jgi:Tfp pilus assembly protein PilF
MIPGRTALAVTISLLLLIVVAAGVKALLGVARDPAFPLFSTSGTAQWIRYPTPPSLQPHTAVWLCAKFRREFPLHELPQRAILKIKAFKKFRAAINGQLLLLDNEAHRDGPRLDVTPYLVPGDNEIAVDVYHDRGPPSLWLSLDLDGEKIETDHSWQVSLAGSTERKAQLMSTPIDTSHVSTGRPFPRMRESLRSKWLGLIFLAATWFAIFITAELVLRRRRKAATPLIQSPRISYITCALLVVTLLWVLLFWNNLPSLSRADGFDALAHLDYVQYVLNHKRAPWPDEGWSMFQPPLYYALSAAVLSLAGLSTLDKSAVPLLRLQGLILGLIQILLVTASLRILFPKRKQAQLIGIVLAAFLPIHLYVYQFVTNETLAATLSSAGVYLCLRILREPRASTTFYTALGLCLGGAMLAKFSALAVILGITAVLAARLLRERRALLEWIRTLGVTVAVSTAICGWRFVGVWRRFGDPFVGNWDPRVGHPWWQDPGFHTASYYLHFGLSFEAPYFSGFWSFWDGLYSTFWGDGLAGGHNVLWAAPPWNYDLMTAGYLLALVPTAGILLGLGTSLVQIIRRWEASWILLVSVVGLFLGAFIYMSLAVPSYAQIKAFYAMGAVVPLCVFGASGLDILMRRNVLLRLILMTALATWAANAYASFFIARGKAEVDARLRLMSLQLPGHAQMAEDYLASALRKDSRNAVALQGMALLLKRQGKINEAILQIRELLRDDPDNANGHLLLATYLTSAGLTDEGLRHARRATELEPDQSLSWYVLGTIEIQRGRIRAALDAFRRTLGIAPDFAPAHQRLAELLRSEGNFEEAAVHERLAREIAILSVMKPSPFKKN